MGRYIELLSIPSACMKNGGWCREAHLPQSPRHPFPRDEEKTRIFSSELLSNSFSMPRGSPALTGMAGPAARPGESEPRCQLPGTVTYVSLSLNFYGFVLVFNFFFSLSKTFIWKLREKPHAARSAAHRRSPGGTWRLRGHRAPGGTR